MPKRLRPLNSPGLKRAKTNVDQPLINHFFSPGGSKFKHDVDNTLPSGSSRSFESGLSVDSLGRKPSREIIDVDLLEIPDDENAKHTGSPTNVRKLGSIFYSSSSTSTMKFDAPTPQVVFDNLGQDASTYTPPIQPWPSTTVPYSFLAHALSALTQTRSRILIINILTNTLRTIILYDPESLLPAIYLLSNSLAPPHVTVELGLGPSIISQSIQHVSGLTGPALKRLYNSTGDVGDVAFAAKSNVRTLLPHPPLLVPYVYKSLLKVAHTQGKGAAKGKQKVVEKLLLAAVGEEVRFLARTLSQNLRVGAVRTSILTALSHAMALIPRFHFGDGISHAPESYHASSDLLSKIKEVSSGKGKAVDAARGQLSAKFAEAESLVKRVYVQHPDYEHITAALLQNGLDGLQEAVFLTVGVPLHPTLGSPTHSLNQIYGISGDRPFMAEFKYDGQRAQIHASIDKGKISISIFSRHLEDMTSKYPDVISTAKCIFELHPETSSFILDSEIVAIDSDGSLKSFQDLSNRARKDVQLQEIQVPVCVYAFDLMYLDGKILLENTFRERRAALYTRFPPFCPADRRAARFEHVESCGSEEGRDAVEAFWERAIGSRCEGLMVKLLDNEPMIEGNSNDDKGSKSRRKQLPATYEPDKRTSAWLKLKKDYVKGLGDTLDLVPIGAWHGNGRKAGWWSPVLLGLWQPESGQVVAVCKCMSGFTDAFYRGLAERYQLSDDSDTCTVEALWGCDTGGLKPEVYFKPQEVWEIRGADITLSPVSVAAKGLISDTRGLSLRFPRFLRVRDEKSIEQASTPQFLANMWKHQQGKEDAHVGVDDGELVDLDDEVEEESDVENLLE